MADRPSMERSVQRPTVFEKCINLEDEDNLRQLVDDLDNGGGYIVVKRGMSELLGHPYSSKIPDYSENNVKLRSF